MNPPTRLFHCLIKACHVSLVSVALLYTAIISSGAAHAEETAKVPIAAPAAWVVPVKLSASLKAEGAVDIRLLDIQTRIDQQGLHQHFHQIARILTPEGLTALGNFGVAWQPNMSVATVHTVKIWRDGVVIDVLRGGAAFQILRREANLEKLQIDGSLTALLSITDLRVGDELETSWTLDSMNPVLNGNNENLLSLTPGAHYGQFFLRYSWPVGRDVRWRMGSALPQAIPFKTDSEAGLLVQKSDFSVPARPDGAPPRFSLAYAMEVSEFRDWKAVATIMQPLYDSAARVGVDSPIQAEIRRIAAMSADPAVRATEALKTVQGKVRYFARVDGLGGYKPETADAVWLSRAGDCKGKTVLLLAMLRGLGIEADAALVSSGFGNAIDLALPMAARFDHVIVRANIGGKTYWLDGTRLGDQSIKAIEVPNFKWALPLSATVKGLEPIVVVDPVTPRSEWRLDLDARAGIDKPAKASASAIFRGDEASFWRSTLSVMSKTNADFFLRSTWTERHDWIKIDSVSWAFNAETGDLRLEMNGSGSMDWNNSGEKRYDAYEADYATLGQTLTSKRIEALQSIAPIFVGRRFTATHQTILLPDGGRGFTLDGANIDTVVGGVRYRRTARLVGEKFDMSASTQSSEGELSYTDAIAADKATDELFKKRLFIDLPAKAAPQVAKALPKAAPKPITLRGKAARAELIGGSITDEDYPPVAIREGQSGTTVVSFDVGIDGRVSDCGITQTSGSTALDDQSCALIRERFIYKPAKGPNGKPTTDARTQRVTWRLPEDASGQQGYDLTFSYIVGVDGVARDCKAEGQPAPPVPTAEQCAKAGGGKAMLGDDGSPVAAKVVERHSRTITPLAAEAPK
jgi:TonB family protein